MPFDVMVGAVGLEPTMRGLKGRCFDDFSFAPKLELHIGVWSAMRGLNSHGLAPGAV